jgi:thiamine phosphate synthase YjbQ (UPF0047 family)
MVVTHQFHLSTQGFCDFHNITQAVVGAVKSSEPAKWYRHRFYPQRDQRHYNRRI